MILTAKNWKSFQHYKERAPSWIKLHKGSLLSMRIFISLKLLGISAKLANYAVRISPEIRVMK